MTLHFEVFNEDVEEALALLAEQLFASTVPDDRFAKERRVVIDEIRGRQEDPANCAPRAGVAPLLRRRLSAIRSAARSRACAAMTPQARPHVSSRGTSCRRTWCSAASGGVSARPPAPRRSARFPRGAGGRRAWPAGPAGAARRFVRLHRADLTQAYLVRLAHVPRDLARRSRCRSRSRSSAPIPTRDSSRRSASGSDSATTSAHRSSTGPTGRPP